MCRGCLSSLKYSLICVSERWRPNQVFHQNKKGISTISQATRKKRKRFRTDMWRREVASCEDATSESFCVSSGGYGGMEWLAMFFAGFSPLWMPAVPSEV